MARDTTPAYVVEVSTPGYRWTPAAWNYRRDGRPTDARLAEYVRRFEASTRPGGPNAHLGAVRVASARVRRNHLGGETVATYAAPAAPLFEVIAESGVSGHADT